MIRVNALVVDDNVVLSENVAEILNDGFEEYEVRCHSAQRADEALRIASENDIDIALIDLHLPDAQGTQLIAELNQRSPHVQVIIITGDSAVESAIGAMQKGAFGYVLKPFSGQELLETTRSAIERAHLAREAERLRRELTLSERRHRAVIETVPALVVALDGAGAIVVWNRRIEELTGYTRAQMLGTPGSRVVPGEGDHELALRGGGHRLVRWQIAEVPEGAQQDASVYAVGIDVSTERDMQLRARRAERLAAVGTLAAGLAHEVRNPLNSASLQLQVLERRARKLGRDEERIIPVVRLVHDEIRRLDHLVTDFLDFARPRPLEVSPTALSSVVDRAVELVRPVALHASVEVRRLGPTPPLIVAIDPERMQQVFLNLMGNAVEAMTGGGLLTVRWHAADPGFAAVEIEDSGPGFDARQPIFDAFFTTKDGGTGLGLAIVHRIVGEHGGSIEVKSKPGQTIFTFTLPLARSAPHI